MAKKKKTNKNKQIKRSTKTVNARKVHPKIESPPVPNFDRFQALFLVILIAVGAIIYSNTLDSPFVFDDIKAIKDNSLIRMTEISRVNITNSFISYSGGKRPLPLLSFAFNYYFGQYNVIGYHLVNIIIHVINGILLFFFLKTTLMISKPQKVIKSKPDPLTVLSLSFVSALLWLVNPIQTQSVTYIVQRMNSMGAMFFILALLLYAKGRFAQQNKFSDLDLKTVNSGRRKFPNHYFWFTGCFLAGILALVSKQNTAVLPFFIFLYEWYFFQDLGKEWLKKQLKIIGAIVILFGIVAAIYLGPEPWHKINNIRDFAQGEFTMGERLLTQTRVVIYYLSLIFYPNPSRLNLDYDFALSFSLINPITTILSLAAIVGLFALAVYSAKKDRLISFCILWFLGNLVIESSVIPLAIIFEHRLYLPSMLVCLPAVILAHRYIRPKWLVLGVLCTVVAVFSVWTFERNKVWRDEVTLWKDIIKKSPNKPRPHNNLAVILSDRGKTDEAIAHYSEALRIKPDFAEGHNNMGAALYKQGRLEAAIAHYSAALKINPHYAEAHNNMGAAIDEQGQIKEAVEHYRKALQIEPEYADAHNNLGVAMAVQGKSTEAVNHFREALRLNPSFVGALCNLGNAMATQGKLRDAIAYFSKALHLNPGDTQIRQYLERTQRKLAKAGK